MTASQPAALCTQPRAPSPQPCAPGLQPHACSPRPLVRSPQPSCVQVNRINDFWKPFYFRHVETFLSRGRIEELVPLKHFLHRFTRSIFWELEDMIPFSNHVVYRCLWGWLGAPEVSLLML